MPLTHQKCLLTKPESADRKLADGGGLYLLVRKGGAKSWRFNYKYFGMYKTLVYGRFPKVGLAEARKLHEKAKEILESGRDPGTADMSFGKLTKFSDVAEKWLRSREVTWSPGHGLRVRNAVERDLIAVIGEMPISKMQAVHVLDALRKIEERGAHETARRIMQYASKIFSYAVACGYVEQNPVPDLTDALVPKPKTRHMSALREEELPDFFRALDAYDVSTAE